MAVSRWTVKVVSQDLGEDRLLVVEAETADAAETAALAQAGSGYVAEFALPEEEYAEQVGTDAVD